MIKAEFSASLLQSSVSHDPSEIILIYWFAAQETFMIISNVGVKKTENLCCLIFCENSNISKSFPSFEYKVQSLK